MLSSRTNQSKFILLIFILLLVVLCFLIVKPFALSIITAAVLAYLFYPLFLRINSKIKNSSLSAVTLIFLLVMLLAIPLYFVIQGLYIETKSLIMSYSSLNLPEISPEILGLLNEGMQKIAGFLAEKASEMIFSLPLLILNLFILIFALFYFLKEGPSLIYSAESLLPFQKSEKEFLNKEFKGVTSAVVNGILLTSLLEGVLGGFIFYLFGISSPILWGFIMFILAIIPGVGTYLIWIPAGLIKIIEGHILAGVGIIILGILVIMLIEFLLRQKIIHDKSKIHPIAVLLGALGGLKLLGFVGIIIGPLVLSLLIHFVEVFILEK